MKNYVKIIILLLAISFLSGCGSSGYAITYNTSPQGASVICNGKHEGYSPVKLYYEFDMEKRYGYSEPCYTQWSSTGKKHYSTTWDLKKFPNGVIQTLDIPISAKSSYSSSNSSSSSSNNSSSGSSSVYGSSGSTYQQFGNTTYGSDGTTYQQFGNTTYKSDGTTLQQFGNTSYSSDGTTYQQFGNTSYSSDGTICQKFGNTTYCN